MVRTKNKESSVCDFCTLPKDIEDRMFYEGNDWVAFLNSPPYADGHTLLSARNITNNCPESLEELTGNHLQNLGDCLRKVSKALKEVYKVDNVLIGSLRGKIKHFHFHLIPLNKTNEKEWRKEKLYEEGHLFEFLGDLEKEKFIEAQRERIEKGWNKERQREEHTKKLQEEVIRLKKVIENAS